MGGVESKWIKVLQGENLYINVYYNYPYRPYEVTNITKRIIGNKIILRVHLELTAVIRTRRMEANVILRRINEDLFSVEFTKGVRDIEVYTGTIQRVMQRYWRSRLSFRCFSGETSRGTPGKELWRVAVATRKEGK